MHVSVLQLYSCLHIYTYKYICVFDTATTTALFLLLSMTGVLPPVHPSNPVPVQSAIIAPQIAKRPPSRYS